jgi:selenide,water dikinase
MDDAGVFAHGRGEALVQTVDFFTPVVDDPFDFGQIAAANALSDVYAMGGNPLTALALMCVPDDLPREVLREVVRGGLAKMREAGASVLGGHSVRDPELKFGLAVTGEADPARLLTNAGARQGDRLILTKPLGTGVLINAFKFDKLDEAGLEPALREMERLNAEASRLALAHGVHAATDITGFGLAGHALGMAKASGVGMRILFESLPVYDDFYRLGRSGVTTGCTRANEDNVRAAFTDHAGLDPVRRDLLFDPQTSGGLLLSTPPDQAGPLLQALAGTGHRAAEIGEVTAGPARLDVV